MTTPMRATYKGHGYPTTFLFLGYDRKPNAEGRVVKAVPGRYSGYNFIDVETGETVWSCGSAGKFWAAPVEPAGKSAPAPAADSPATPVEPAAESVATRGKGRRGWFCVFEWRADNDYREERALVRFRTQRIAERYAERDPFHIVKWVPDTPTN